MFLMVAVSASFLCMPSPLPLQYGNTFYTTALANGGLLVANNTGYSINTAVVAWENRTYSKIVHIVRFGLDIDY